MSKVIHVGSVVIGGGNPVAIQSMTTTKTNDVARTVSQIQQLQGAGCEIVRVAVPDMESARAISSIKKEIKIPLVADIHFDHNLAVESIKNGADKVRINPGNLSSEWKVIEVVRAATEYGVPIRVGANIGSVPDELFSRYSRPVALAEAGLKQVRLLEKHGFGEIVVSVKSSDVLETIEATEYIARMTDYPVHIGVTEAGLYEDAIIRSSVALGYLLLQGIGDTIRISVAGDPILEVIAAKKLLISLKMRKGFNLIACPTCARAEIDVAQLSLEVQREMSDMNDMNITVAVMGCVVNGIGEGKHADIGVAGTKSGAVIFKNGRILKTVERSAILEELRKQIQLLVR
ncbi:MAG: flavodoxin-dependent (E)-4-hydroxy-3-methylbut-2-enyl-diphosphate synthase [Thermotogaceae bacterium]|nr:flavodoxin-dependent (E)-4-hydroxy-3-methylbut-2-enyl-diphosphate synthase [Thermotogaceae bacterium]